VFDSAVRGVSDLQHLLQSPVARLRVVPVPHDPWVDLTGDVDAVFGNDLDDVVDALLAHRRRRRVFVVRDPDVRGLHPP